MSRPAKRRADDSINGNKPGKPRFNKMMTRSRSRSGIRATVVNVNKDFEYPGYAKKQRSRSTKRKTIIKRKDQNHVNVAKDTTVNDRNNNATVANAYRRKLNLGKTRIEIPRSKKIINDKCNFVDDGVVVSVDAAEEEEYPEEDLDEEMDSIEEEQQEATRRVVDRNDSSSAAESRGAKARKLLKDNPDLKDLFNEMLDDRIKDVQKLTEKGKINDKNKELDSDSSARAANKSDKRDLAQQSQTEENEEEDVITTPVKRNRNVIKSPSDTTLYRPVFQREKDKGEQANSFKGDNNHLVDQITRFVESIRMQTEDKRAKSKESNGEDTAEQQDDEPQPSTSGMQQRSEISVPGFKDAQDKVTKTVLDAEKFKAVLANPPGENISHYLHEIPSNNIAVDGEKHHKSDDDFFHLICHVEPALISKIEKGEFVDLEKLLPRDKFGSRPIEQKLQWVSNEDGAFLTPMMDKTAKINSFRKWEQAFRVYATVYCGANPTRSKEIWQYVSVISTAASSFVSDNVANYDYTFRQLMAYNPLRSWAVTYNQMWALSMRDPLPKNHIPRSVGYYGGGGAQNFHTPPGNNNQNKSGNKWVKSPQYCWSFNKGVTCKYGKACKYIERCSYCNSYNHGVNVCPKFGKEQGSNSNNSNGNNNGGNGDRKSGGGFKKNMSS